MDYVNSELYIAGRRTGVGDTVLDVVNPADETVLGTIPCVGEDALRSCVEATVRGFDEWRWTGPRERAAVLGRAADLLTARIEEISRAVTLEQGKPLREARAEWTAAIDVLRWYGEEVRRTYGRVVPGESGVRHLVVSEPVGPVVALTPWNVPALAVARKVAPALAAGCSVIVRGPSETPSAASAIVGAIHEAGLPPRVLQLVYGAAAPISEYLLRSSAVRKVSFTGSTRVGRIVAGLAAEGLKRATLELGGHAPVLVFPDVDVRHAAREAVRWKFRNAGQICASPTRFLVHESIADRFVAEFVTATEELVVGSGLDEVTDMGPLLTAERREAVEELVADAESGGAEVVTGGQRVTGPGFFYQPTVLTGVDDSCRIMNEEPFGPVAPIGTFAGYTDAITSANRLPFGLAAFVLTDSVATANAASRDIEAGVVGINDFNCSRCEVPFGGIKDTGWGQEGGVEGIEPYLTRKAVLHA